jgi:uncharacterized damage-inducible protein DinB
MAWPEPFPDLDADERTTLTQHLDHWRERMIVKLADLTPDEATAAALPATDLTVAGVVRHLAQVEDRWFHFRLAGNDMPEPWASADTSRPDWTFELDPGESADSVLEQYRTSCQRSRRVEASLGSLDDRAPTPSFGKVPITLRWALTHMIGETACHAGHVDLLRDEILHRRQH